MRHAKVVMPDGEEIYFGEKLDGLTAVFRPRTNRYPTLMSEPAVEILWKWLVDLGGGTVFHLKPHGT